jgi:hypothetical protein
MKIILATFFCFSVFLVFGSADAAYYVGSDQCFNCHADQFNDWQSSGHPWKIRKAAKARYAKLPLPPGYSWDEISYVIGGATKKARFIDLEGFIITGAKDGSEAKTQYNIEDGSWSFYHKGEKKPYKCGPCHMTGYSPEGNQDGRPGLIGTWVEDGRPAVNVTSVAASIPAPLCQEGLSGIMNRLTNYCQGLTMNWLVLNVMTHIKGLSLSKITVQIATMTQPHPIPGIFMPRMA